MILPVTAYATSFQETESEKCLKRSPYYMKYRNEQKTQDNTCTRHSGVANGDCFVSRGASQIFF